MPLNIPWGKGHTAKFLEVVHILARDKCIRPSGFTGNSKTTIFLRTTHVGSKKSSNGLMVPQIILGPTFLQFPSHLVYIFRHRGTYPMHNSHQESCACNCTITVPMAEQTQLSIQYSICMFHITNQPFHKRQLTTDTEPLLRISKNFLPQAGDC